MTHYLPTLGIIALYGMLIFVIAMIRSPKKAEAGSSPTPPRGGESEVEADNIDESFKEFRAALHRRPIAKDSPLVNAQKKRA